jgi:hypothetical protein
MKITIKEKEFEIDIERAKELGICKEVKKINEIKAGDVFEGSRARVVIFQPIYGIEEFIIVGIDGLQPFSNFHELQTRYEMTEFLSEGDYTFIANINDQILELIRSA